MGLLRLQNACPALLLLSGCGALIGIDLDGARVHQDGGIALKDSGSNPKPDIADAGSASALDAASGDAAIAPPVPPDDAGRCTADRHLCGAACVSLQDPRYGCATGSCSPCKPPANATATCAAAACDFTCASGFVRAGSACVVSTPASWTIEHTATNGQLWQMWGAGGRLYAAGNGILSSSGGGTWALDGAPATETFWNIWGTGPNDVYAVTTSGTIYHSITSGSWTPQSSGSTQTIFGIWGSSSSDIYAVGEAIRHSTGDGTWTVQSNAVASLFSVWGSSSADIYAVGPSGNILHSTGAGTWVAQTSGTSETLWSVWGSSSSDVYAVGSRGTILHSTGNGVWTPQTSGTTALLADIQGSGSNDVYAVGGGGVLLHSDGGGSWSSENSGTSEDLYSLWTSAGTGLYTSSLATIRHRP